MKNPTFITMVLFGIIVFTGCNKIPDPEVVSQFVSTYSVTETWTENGKTIIGVPQRIRTIIITRGSRISRMAPSM